MVVGSQWSLHAKCYQIYCCTFQMDCSIKYVASQGASNTGWLHQKHLVQGQKRIANGHCTRSAPPPPPQTALSPVIIRGLFSVEQQRRVLTVTLPESIRPVNIEVDSTRVRLTSHECCSLWWRRCETGGVTRGPRRAQHLRAPTRSAYICFINPLY